MVPSRADQLAAKSRLGVEGGVSSRGKDPPK